jgi:hypothetical protein
LQRLAFLSLKDISTESRSSILFCRDSIYIIVKQV